jgi:hypothetical protein
MKLAISKISRLYSYGIGLLLSTLLVPQAVYAVDLSAFLIPERNRSEASYVGVKTVTLQYPEGSSLAQEFNGKNERVQFQLNGTAGEQDDTGMSALISKVNNAFVQAQSPVQISQAELSYTGVLRGEPTSTLISYKVELKPILENFVITKEGGQDIIDLEWRGIFVQDPLVVNAPDVGEIDINHPIGLLQALHATVAEKLTNTDATEVMQDPILNFKAFDTPMGSWHRLFDPVGAYGGSVELGGTEGAKALSVYSLGESSLREGAYSETEKEADVTIDGTAVNIKSTTPPPSGQITIAGYANHQENEGTEFAIVSAEAPAGAQTSTGGFPIQVLLVLGGMMGAIAIFILIKARK